MSCSIELLNWMEGRYAENNIDCVIYNNVHNIGNNVVYDDRIVDDNVYYKGQNKGRKDSLIKAETTLYLEKHRKTEYIYVGLIVGVELVSKIPINEFKLIIDRKHIQNGYKSGDILNYVEGLKKGKGSYWAKRSSLINLGFTDKGNMAEGIIPVKKRSFK